MVGHRTQRRQQVTHLFFQPLLLPVAVVAEQVPPQAQVDQVAAVEPTIRQILAAQAIHQLPHPVKAMRAAQTMAIQAAVVVAQVLWAAQVEPVTHRVVLAASAVKAVSQALPHTIVVVGAGQALVASLAARLVWVAWAAAAMQAKHRAVWQVQPVRPTPEVVVAQQVQARQPTEVPVEVVW
jgi:hypothetical protein